MREREREREREILNIPTWRKRRLEKEEEELSGRKMRVEKLSLRMKIEELKIIVFISFSYFSMWHTHTHTQKISTSWTMYVLMWSSACHGAQYAVTTSQSTCCGYCVSNRSMPTLCLKDPRRGVDTIQLDLLLTATWRIEKTRCLTNNKKSFLLKHVCETINGKKKKKKYRERKSADEVRLEWH